eukprot:scaffold2142_cov165-Amphora_coffeaeformis.AAC.9
MSVAEDVEYFQDECNALKRARVSKSHNDLSGSTQSLADGLMVNSTLTTIRLGGCRLTDVNFSPFIAALMTSRQSVLHTLDLRGNRLTHVSVRQLLEAVRIRGCIRNLLLGHNHFLFGNDAAWRHLVDFLRITTTPISLERLDIHSCNLPNEAVIEVFQALEVNKFLKHIDLDIHDARGIEHMLQSLPKLSIESLAFQDFVSREAEDIEDRLVKAVDKNTSLRSLQYSNLELDLSPKAELAMDCTTGRNIMDSLVQAKAPPALWPSALPFFGRVQGRVGPSMLFYAVQSNIQTLIPRDAQKRRRGKCDDVVD